MVLNWVNTFCVDYLTVYFLSFVTENIKFYYLCLTIVGTFTNKFHTLNVTTIMGQK